MSCGPPCRPRTGRWWRRAASSRRASSWTRIPARWSSPRPSRASGGRFDLEHAGRLAGWAARRIGGSKRRYDVAGQYGLGGFLVLLPQAEREAAEKASRRLGQVLADPAHEGLPEAHAHFGVASV